MTAVEPKIAERRSRVTEERARRRVRWLVLVIAVVALGAIGFWLVKSPVLSIREVQAVGAVRSAPIHAAAAVGVVAGVPTISVDEGAVLDALRSDPWIESASVDVSWPGKVVIHVTEHVAAATVTDGSTWAAIASGGEVLEIVDGSSGPVIEVTSLPPPGTVMGAGVVTGAVTFVAALESEVAATTTVVVAGNALHVSIGDRTVRLGRPVLMAEKAAVVTALLETGVPAGATIDVTAPSHPAVLLAAQPSTSG